MTSAGSVLLVNISSHLSFSGEVFTPGPLKKVKIVSLARLLSSPETTTELLVASESRGKPLSVAAVPQKVGTTETFLILVGCRDGSIIEIYGTTSGSIIKRYNAQACSRWQILAIQPLTAPGCQIAACTVTSAEQEDETEASGIVLCCGYAATTRDSRFAAATASEDDGEGIWKETDPSVTCNDQSIANIADVSSFFLGSDTTPLLHLVLPTDVIARRRDELEMRNVPVPRSTSDENNQILISPLLMHGSSFIQSMLAFARHGLRGVKALSFVAARGEVECGWVATMCPALRAIYLYNLPSSPPTECATELHPSVQIDLVPLLEQECLGGQALLEVGEVPVAGVVNGDELLIGTNRSRLLACNVASLQVAHNFALQGRFTAISETPLVVVSSLAIYHVKDGQGKCESTTTTDCCAETILAITASLECLSLSLDEQRNTAPFLDCLLWVGHEWERKCLDADLLLELATRSLLYVAHYDSSFPPLPVDIVDNISGSSSVWTELSSLTPGQIDGPTARRLLKKIILYAVNHQHSAVVRLAELCADSRDLPSLAMLLYSCNELDASAAVYFSIAEQGSSCTVEALFAIADAHLDKLTTLPWGSTAIFATSAGILLGLLASLRRRGCLCIEAQERISGTWGTFTTQNRKKKLAMQSLRYILLQAEESRPVCEAREFFADMSGAFALELLSGGGGDVRKTS